MSDTFSQNETRGAGDETRYLTLPFDPQRRAGLQRLFADYQRRKEKDPVKSTGETPTQEMLRYRIIILGILLDKGGVDTTAVEVALSGKTEEPGHLPFDWCIFRAAVDIITGYVERGESGGKKLPE